MADDGEVLAHITALVEEEHALRDKRTSGEISGDDEQARLLTVEQELDQCWDLLRQRRAKREFGANPDEAAVRPVEQVENYKG